jgi:hypothetical protein
LTGACRGIQAGRESLVLHEFEVWTIMTFTEAPSSREIFAKSIKRSSHLTPSPLFITKFENIETAAAAMIVICSQEILC